jgi:hypothetical protein
MKCVCGYRKFRETVRTVDETVERWVHFSPDTESAGFGTAPFGTVFGAGGSSMWGLFDLDVARPMRFLNCESCGRTRSAVATGGVGAFGGYVASGLVYVIATDASLVTCLRVRFTQGATQHTVEVSPYYGLPLPIVLDTPATTSDDVPTSGELAGVLRATPPVGLSGEYVVSLVDICLGTSVELFTASFST